MKKPLCMLWALCIFASFFGCQAEPAVSPTPDSVPVNTTAGLTVSPSATSSPTSSPLIRELELPEEIAAKLASGYDAWDAVMPAEVPKPDAVRFELTADSIACFGFDETSAAAYETRLAENGFAPAGTDLYGSFYSYGGSNYIKDNLLVQFNSCIYSANAEENYILIYAHAYLQRDSIPEGAVSNSEALTLINAYLKENGLATVAASAALEIDIPGLFEKMGVQAFRIFGVTFAENVDQIRVYVIIAGNALPLNDPLQTTCIADIDSDGLYELFSVFGQGSGIFRLTLIAYCVDDDGCFMTKYGQGYVPDDGYAELYIEAEGENGVCIWGANRWVGQLYRTADYGPVMIVNGAGLMPEDTEAFPFNHTS